MMVVAMLLVLLVSKRERSGSRSCSDEEKRGSRDRMLLKPVATHLRHEGIFYCVSF